MGIVQEVQGRRWESLQCDGNFLEAPDRRRPSSNTSNSLTDYDALARFAVDDQNKSLSFLEQLKFCRLVSAERMLVAGLLVIEAEAEQGGQIKQYEAEVYERSWENYLGLMGWNFKPDAASEVAS